MLRSVMKAITKAVDFVIIANVDHIKQKRQLNSINDDYRGFRKEFFDAADNAVLGDDRYNFDKWVSIGELALLFHKASNAPVHMTEYDKQQHFKPVLNKLRNRIQNGEITGYRSGDVDSLDDYHVRAARVWETVVQSDMPDGGINCVSASFHDEQTKNDEVPRPLYKDGKEHKEWLNVKTPLIYALAIAADSSKGRASNAAFKYNREEHGDIKMRSNSPYMP